jgi:nucleotide-binding universal stress UspA family protein
MPENSVLTSMHSEISRIRFKNILYATDFSPLSRAALPYALAMAQHYGSKIFVVHVIPPEMYMYSPPDFPAPLLDVTELAANEQMRTLISSVALGDIPHQGIVKVGEIWEVISSEVNEHNIDLIVVGTRGRCGLSKFLKGSAAEEIFRLTKCPVLTVGPRSVDTPPQHELDTILLAIDFSDESIGTVKYASSIAEEFQSRLIAMHVAPSPDTDPNVKMRLSDFFSERLNEVLPPEAMPWCKLETIVEFGAPAEAILRISRDRQAELIVMGAKGAGGVPGIASHFGTTAHRIVTEAHCPVLTVRGRSETHIDSPD